MPSKPSSRSGDDGSLEGFVEDIVGDEHLRVEEDLGHGFVRLKSSEAERRQAAQDIRSSEDILLEMLRNARDAGARNIFIATGKEGPMRSIVMVDDGDGVPDDMHERIFQPRVTSKLDSAKLDKWGIHGRGMALYSISMNAEYSGIESSAPDMGSSIKVLSDTRSLPERADQSTFPIFERTDSGFSMRGPKNILRTAAEFAFEHRKSLSVYCGSDTEIVATLYDHGTKSLPAAKRVFGDSSDGVPITQSISMAADDAQLVADSAKLGIGISSRSARRILDGDILPVPTLMERLESESFPSSAHVRSDEDELGSKASHLSPFGHPPTPKLSGDDMRALEEASADAFKQIAERYYLQGVEPKARQRGSKLLIEFDILEKNS